VELWAHSLAAGLPDDVFWASTPAEVYTLLRVHGDRTANLEEARAKRARYFTAWIACEIRNQWLKKGKKPWKPDDLLPKKREPWTPEAMINFMRSWSEARNRKVEA
jgi:hypothetical protein